MGEAKLRKEDGLFPGITSMPISFREALNSSGEDEWRSFTSLATCTASSRIDERPSLDFKPPERYLDENDFAALDRMDRRDPLEDSVWLDDADFEENTDLVDLAWGALPLEGLLKKESKLGLSFSFPLSRELDPRLTGSERALGGA